MVVPPRFVSWPGGLIITRSVFFALAAFGPVTGAPSRHRYCFHFPREEKGADVMTITPEKKREIEVEIAKFLLHLTAEKKERIDVINVKDFSLNRNPQPASLSLR